MMSGRDIRCRTDHVFAPYVDCSFTLIAITHLLGVTILRDRPAGRLRAARASPERAERPTDRIHLERAHLLRVQMREARRPQLGQRVRRLCRSGRLRPRARPPATAETRARKIPRPRTARRAPTAQADAEAPRRSTHPRGRTTTARRDAARAAETPADATSQLPSTFSGRTRHVIAGVPVPSIADGHPPPMKYSPEGSCFNDSAAPDAADRGRQHRRSRGRSAASAARAAATGRSRPTVVGHPGAPCARGEHDPRRGQAFPVEGRPSHRVTRALQPDRARADAVADAARRRRGGERARRLRRVGLPVARAVGAERALRL